MNKIYKSYFNEYIELFPSINDYLGLKEYSEFKRFFENSISPNHITYHIQFIKKYLKLLDIYKDNSINYKILRYNLLNTLDLYNYNLHLMPLNHTDSVISYFIELSSGNSIYKFSTKKDYIFFIEKSGYFVIYINQCIINMKDGINKKIVIPQRICKLLIEQIKEILKKKSYLKDKYPKDIPNYNTIIENNLVPILKKLLNFLVKEYYPKCNKKIGLSTIPYGKKIYQKLVDTYTTISNINIKDIHEYGINEVERIHSGMELIKNKLNFNGSLIQFNKSINNDKNNKFKNGKEVITTYKKMQNEIIENIYKSKFDINLSHIYLIKEVPKFNRKFAPSAYYMSGNIDGTRKGTFYINTGNLSEMNKMDVESLSLHEGIPGHHLQLTYLLDNNFPLFLKTMDFTAYEEGWALYCENLGEYKNPLSFYGKLNMEMLRAIRLVVDTGIHYYNWTFDKCFKYFKKYSSFLDEEIKSELHRYIAIPGQALAYKIGEKEFLKLRTKSKNNDKLFHNKVIKKGPLPLFLLKNIEI